MCGITGIINFKEKVRSPISILEMQASLKHRGPDAHGNYFSEDGNVIFGHRRLSLVGLDDRATVMSIPKKSNSKLEVAIVFNGEIYNFKELKKYFSKKGYTSVSPSDFEVIIFAWEEWGINCVDHLIGEFAFVLYDEETKQVFMARDRTGVKPLFYAITKQGEFLFASEPKAILKYPDISNSLDNQAVAEFFLMVHTFAAGNQNERSSYFEEIKQFPPAHKALLDKKGFHMSKYYDLPFGDKLNKKDNIQRIRKLLTKSVSDRIPDEVPVSVGLSGGLDSSIICALIKRDKKSRKILASCIRYTGDTNDDYKHAQILAKKDKINLISPNLSPKEMIQGINECIVSLDGPVDSIRRIGMHANYKTLRQHGYKCTLIGEGADEFNLGYYQKFPGLKLDKEYCKDKTSLKKLFMQRAEYVNQFFTSEFKKKFNYEKIAEEIILENYESCKAKDPTTKMQYFYAKRFLLYLEDGNDRASMSSSVEARLPFVDPDLIKASVAVPMEQNVIGNTEKNVLRDAFKNILPVEIYKRIKAPFPANEDIKFHKLLLGELNKEIKIASNSIWNILDKNFIISFSNNFENKIKELEKTYGKNKGGQALTAWLPISKPVELRANHLFSVLTFLRWYKMNFK